MTGLDDLLNRVGIRPAEFLKGAYGNSAARLGMNPDEEANFFATANAKDPTEFMQALPGDLAGMFGHGMALPKRGVESALGHTLYPVVQSGIGGQPDVRQEQLALHQNDSGEEKFKQLVGTSEGPQGAIELLSSLALDPFNYVGFGLPGRAAGLASRIANPQLRQGVVSSLRFLDNLDAEVGQIGQQAAMAPLQAAGWGVSHLPNVGNILKNVDEMGVKTPAANVGDYLSSRSGEAQYKLWIRDVSDTFKRLRDSGHQLWLDYADTTLGGNLHSPWPGTTQAAKDILDQMETAFRQRVTTEENPMVQSAGVLLWHRAEQIVRSNWEQAFLVRQRALDHYGVDVGTMAVAQEHNLMPVYNQITQAFQHAYESNATVLNAASGTLDRVSGKLANEPSTVPQSFTETQAPYWHNLLNEAMSSINHTVTDYGQRLEALPVDQRAHLIEERNNQLDEIARTFAGGLGNLGDVFSQGTGKLLAQRLDQMNHLGQGLPGIVADLPNRLTARGVAADAFGQATDQLRNIGRDQRVVQQALEEVWRRYQTAIGNGGANMPRLDWRGIPVTEASQRIDDVNEVLAQMHLAPVQNSVELIQRLTQARLPDGSPMLSVRGLGSQASSTEAGTGLIGAVTRWVDGDLLLSDPYELALGRVARETGHQRFGIKDPNIIQRGASDAMSLWKEQALMTPSYLATNLLSGLAMSTMAGVSPTRALSVLKDNLREAMQGVEVHNANAQRLADIAGVPIPKGTQTGSGFLSDITSTKEYVGRGVSASERIGPLKLSTGLGVLGGIAGGLQDDQNRGTNALKGAALGIAGGAAWPTVGKYFMRAGKAIETTLREEAWTTGAATAIRQQTDDLMQHVIEAVGQSWEGVAPAERHRALHSGQTPPIMDWLQHEITGEVKGPKTNEIPYEPGTALQTDFYVPHPGPQSNDIRDRFRFRPTNERPLTDEELNGLPSTLGGRVIVQKSMSPEQQRQAIEDLRTTLDHQEGFISNNTLQEILMRNGMDIRRAREVGKWWTEQLDHASQSGLQLANHINFDYEDLNNLEQFVKKVVPFSTWGMKAYPFFAQHLFERPAFAIAIKDLNDLSQQQQDERGLTNRFSGSIHIGLGDGLASTILGHPTELWFNPMRGMVPFSDAPRSMDNLKEEGGDNPLAALTSLMSAAGFAANPAVDFATRVTGLQGTDAPARGYLRLAEPIKALTGVDFNRPGMDLEKNVRTALSGREPTDLNTVAILKRIDELALRDTGVPTSQPNAGAVGPYVLAKTQQSGPIWDRAAQEVAGERRIPALAGTLFQGLSPQAMLTPEEAQIREARLTPEQGGSYIKVGRDTAEGLKRLVAEGKGAAPAPASAKEEVTKAAVQLFGDQMPEAMLVRLDRGTNADIEWVRKAVSQIQIQDNPMIVAYSSGSSPEETQINNLLNVYQNPVALLLSDPQYADMPLSALESVAKVHGVYNQLPQETRTRLSGGLTAGGQVIQAVNQRRELLKQSNPLLQQYLAYQAVMRGTGNTKDFLDNHYKRG